MSKCTSVSALSCASKLSRTSATIHQPLHTWRSIRAVGHARPQNFITRECTLDEASMNLPKQGVDAL
eukprot:7644643-Pyramimonas_sp.AAC.1